MGRALQHYCTRARRAARTAPTALSFPERAALVSCAGTAQSCSPSRQPLCPGTSRSPCQLPPDMPLAPRKAPHTRPGLARGSSRELHAAQRRRGVACWCSSATWGGNTYAGARCAAGSRQVDSCHAQPHELAHPNMLQHAASGICKHPASITITVEAHASSCRAHRNPNRANR